jgi:hypothetical protein
MNPYKLYTDKTTMFECKIELEGSSLTSAQARMVVEIGNQTLMFKGNITSDGVCVIPIQRLRTLTNENTLGKMILEVIVEDTYFNPWISECEVSPSKKLTVEVSSPAPTKPKMNISIKKDSIAESVVKNLTSKKIGVNEILKNKKYLHQIIQEHINGTDHKMAEVIPEVIKLLASKE